MAVRDVVLGGLAIVMIAVLLGFSMAGGHIGALIHVPNSSHRRGVVRALIIMSPKKVLMDLLKAIPQVLKGSPHNKGSYADLFGLVYSIARLVRKEG